MRYFLAVPCLALALLGCSDNQNDIGSRSKLNQGDTGAGAGGTGNEADGSSSGGVSGGGASGNGGTSNGGASGDGGASSGGTSPGGASSGGTGGVLPGDSGRPDAPTPVDAGLCDPTCSPTRCAGIDCGPAVCCQGDTAPECLHGVSQCPPSFTRKRLECWQGNDAGSNGLLASCNTAADCFVAKHYTGCCHVEAIGLHVSEFSRFEALETACGGAPPCGCAFDRVYAENGSEGAANATLAVDCVAGVCRTLLR